MLTVLAPAKLNLTLEVLGKRPDGYHEIRSVIQTISLCDVLSFELSEDVKISSNLSEWSPEKSLVAKAVSLLQKTKSVTKGVRIEVTKNIPLVAGLGGDSSDAAATLRGLNELWELELDGNELTELATQLGSDVPFFLYGGTVLMAGRGDIITPLPPLPHHYFVLVPPDIPPPPDKTKQLYASLKSSHYTKGEATEKLMGALGGGGRFDSSLLFNVFENVTFDVFRGLADYRDLMSRAGAENVHLAGSGPTLYTMAETEAEAEGILEKLKRVGVKSHLAETLAAEW
jgi:4-diphosphocytidyl-2-C-methyl-D-erythritol kinase